MNQEEWLRQGFKQFNRFMLLMWRLGLGRGVNGWPSVGGRIMVLVHTGRKSGLRRRTPVNYAMIDGDIYCTAGFGRLSDWYRNIQKQPEVELWLPDGWWTAVAEDISESDWRLPVMRQVLIDSGFAARAAGINPHTMTDADLAAVTDDYRLLRLRRTAARTGTDGPGDLAWIWPVLVILTLPLLLWRRKSRRSG